MRLAFITSEFVTEPNFSGGLANYLGRTTVALAQQGHDVEVFTRAERHGDDDYHGVRVRRVVPLWDRRMVLDHVDRLVPRSFYIAYQDIKAASSIWRAWKKIHRQKPFDVVQAANVQCVGLFFRRVRNAPVVIRLSSYHPYWDQATGVSPTASVRLRWKLDEWTLLRRQYVYAPSHFVAQKVAQAYGLQRVEVVEPPFFQPIAHRDYVQYEEHGLGHNYALFFGRLTRMKGVHILAAALPKILAEFPNLRFLLIGADATAPDGGSMREYVRRKLDPACRNRVLMLDPLSHDKLYPLVENASFVVLPSLIDNLPNTCLEAMGLGRVVIATRGLCFEQLIDDGRSGILVRAGDADDLAAGMLKAAILSDAQREQIGAAARERIDELHPDKAIPRLIEFYERVVSDFRGRTQKRSRSAPRAFENGADLPQQSTNRTLEVAAK